MTTLQDLPALYQQAVTTRLAGDLIRALCEVHGVSLRGFVWLSGMVRSTAIRWRAGGRVNTRALSLLLPLIQPSYSVKKRIAIAHLCYPAGKLGRPKKT